MAGKKGRSGRRRLPPELLPPDSRQHERRGPVVQSPDGRIVQPQWLSVKARVVWKRTLPIVQQMRIMSPADVVALARYCEYLVAWRVALKDNDVPAITKLEAAIHRLETQFGLTPSSRASLPAPHEEKKPEETKAEKYGLVG